mmetsp:Transcript_57680/g.135856  ORF Transcript_57680/g.135856 Transcript_57680/m.135856 type:complete len:236 (-) Transcript_57680:625-1332(-)
MRIQALLDLQPALGELGVRLQPVATELKQSLRLLAGGAVACGMQACLQQLQADCRIQGFERDGVVGALGKQRRQPFLDLRHCLLQRAALRLHAGAAGHHLQELDTARQPAVQRRLAGSQSLQLHQQRRRLIGACGRPQVCSLGQQAGVDLQGQESPADVGCITPPQLVGGCLRLRQDGHCIISRRPLSSRQVEEQAGLPLQPFEIGRMRLPQSPNRRKGSLEHLRGTAVATRQLQ